MVKRISIYILLVGLMLFGAVNIAGATTTTLVLDPTSQVALGSVTASGTSDPKTFITIKVLDSSNNIVVLEVVKTDDAGTYSKTFVIPESATGILKVVSGSGSNVAVAELTAIGPEVIHVTAENKTVVVDDSTEDSVIYVPSNVADATLDMSSVTVINGSTATATTSADLTIHANTSLGQIDVVIPEGTQIEGPSSWNGVINLPRLYSATTVTVTPDTNKTATVNKVIEIGFGDTEITFSTPVRIFVPGQANKDVGYVRGTVFTKIITTLSSDSASALGTNPDGKINVGSDLVIWTKHFTKFVTYTQTSTSSESSGGGGGGGALLSPAYSNTGKAKVNPLAGGKIGLSGDAVVEISAHALQGNDEIEVKITRRNEPQVIPKSLVLISDAFDFTVGDKPTYEFKKKVTISFKFKTDQLAPGVVPYIYYYDTSKNEWIKIGGTVSDSMITAEVEHFTKYAVMYATAPVVQPTTPSAPVQEAGSFSDMNTHWAKGMVADLVKRGIMSGYPDGTFKPQKAMSRAEFTVVLMNIYGISPDAKYQLKFQDAQTIPSWAKGYVAAAAKAGILPTIWGTQFNSKALITRADMAYMIGKLSKVKTTVKPNLSFKDKIPTWAAPYVAYVAEKGIVSGYPDKTFRPAKAMSRAEACAVLAKLKK